MTPFWYQINHYFETAAPFQDMLNAVSCVRAEGIKTALLTNNWKFFPHDCCPPVEKIRNYFDVVSFRFFFLSLPDEIVVVCIFVPGTWQESM